MGNVHAFSFANCQPKWPEGYYDETWNSYSKTSKIWKKYFWITPNDYSQPAFILLQNQQGALLKSFGAGFPGISAVVITSRSRMTDSVPGSWCYTTLW